MSEDLRQAASLVQLHHEMEVGYSRLVTISTDNMLTTNEYRTGVGAHWTFLSDPGRNPDAVVLLGAEARYAEIEYGWIEAGAAVSDTPVSLFRVNRFWE